MQVSETVPIASVFSFAWAGPLSQPKTMIRSGPVSPAAAASVSSRRAEIVRFGHVDPRRQIGQPAERHGCRA